jgi:hypothetical protein
MSPMTIPSPPSWPLLCLRILRSIPLRMRATSFSETSAPNYLSILTIQITARK